MDLAVNSFWEHFSEQAQATLTAQATYIDLDAGDYVFRESDPPNGVYLVLEGGIDIIKQSHHLEQLLTTRLPGEYFGEIAVLDGLGRSSDARARVASQVVLVPLDAVAAILNTEPVTVTLHLFRNILTHLRRTNDQFLHELVHREKLSLVGEMASAIMHDLRNPLAGIQLSADLIGMIHDDAQTVKTCNNIRLQCERVVCMAGELLEFSRGEVRLDLKQTTTEAFLEHFLSLREDYARQTTNVEVSIAAEPGTIMVDSLRLLRLLENLVSNAIQALENHAEGRVEIRAWVESGHFYLAVSDNGPGIPEAIREKIFEPFVTYGKKGGTGLGMAIARNVAEAHGGTLSFVTATNQGTAFTLRLPC